ncbi:MAG: alpha-ketoglutarate-dependent dioxygenase AlkB [Acidimicrobiia bacterium]
MFAETPRAQPSLFGDVEPEFDRSFAELTRVDLDEDAWVEYCPMWLSGDQQLFDELVERADWSQPVVRMYDREVRTPRLVASIDPGLHRLIPGVIDCLSSRYGARLDRVSAGWYRDGNDSVAYHGDRIARERDQAIVATVSLGSPRRFLIRPKAGGNARSFALGHGDLIVMGGACQRTWEHTIPKTRDAAPRIAMMFRHSYD